MKSPSVQNFEILGRPQIVSTLGKLSQVSVAVVGDFCLDAYWTIDRSASEISIETGLKTEPVKLQRYAPGGAGNVVMNLAALAVQQVYPVGVVGDDPFGHELRRLFDHSPISSGGLISQADGWETHTYIKPCVEDRELSRIDQGNFNRLSAATEQKLFARLEETLGKVSVVLINHQVTGSIHDSKSFRQRLRQMTESHPHICFIIDSRGYHEAYPQAIHKLNEKEVMRASGRPVADGDKASLEDVIRQAESLRARWQSPLVVTRGDRGCLVFPDDSPRQIFGLHLPGRVDPVGAGDTFSSAFAAAVSTGADLATAAAVGNIAAAVTAQKLFQTGTASAEEILELGSTANYIYNPELAESLPRAQYIAGSEIELICGPLPDRQIRHAIFDHDGTISTLREGWEKIMEPMMIKSILGVQSETTDEKVRNRVKERVREFIERTTGIQTIAQMAGLVELVHEFGIVPKGQIQSAASYKSIYNEELMALVRLRLAKLDRGELEVSDFTLKGAVPFLRAVRDAGIRLYLASGTDEDDVKNEAERLGYAELFNGGIFGSVGVIEKDAKKMVIERILNEVDGAFDQLIAFGDGPVEMREARRRGALAIGVASDELRRFGLNAEKRSRLIWAGAEAVLPDFSQWQKLFGLLRFPQPHYVASPA
jgi:rfaE bifunctional protein kinase chain/domain